MRTEGESLTDYAKRISERLERAVEAQRRQEPRFDLECAAFDHLATLGLQNVTEGIIALNGDVTPQFTAAAIELQSVSGSEIRVVSNHYSQVQVSYADIMRLREYRDTKGVEHAVERCVRQLMIAQRAEAQAWLDAHPEEAQS